MKLFPRIRTYMITIPQRYRQTDGQLALTIPRYAMLSAIKWFIFATVIVKIKRAHFYGPRCTSSIISTLAVGCHLSSNEITNRLKSFQTTFHLRRKVA